MRVLLHPTYCPNIATFAVMAQHDVVWELADNFQKQTYRNRTYICTDIGKHMMNIPIAHVGGNQGRQLYAAVRLEHKTPWQRTHWRTLQTAYRTSPFFEFYEDDLEPLFQKEVNNLLEFNLKLTAVLCDCLGLDMPQEKTQGYQKEVSEGIDGRFLVNAKQELPFSQQEYNQVFGDRHPFIPNCSVLDLLFNEGPNSLSYLKDQPLDFLNA